MIAATPRKPQAPRDIVSRGPVSSGEICLNSIDADGTSTLPATTFEYAVCNPPALVNASNNVIGGINEPFPVMDQPSIDLLDINADGLPDLLYTPGGATPHQAVIANKTREGRKTIRFAMSIV